MEDVCLRILKYSIHEMTKGERERKQVTGTYPLFFKVGDSTICLKILKEIYLNGKDTLKKDSIFFLYQINKGSKNEKCPSQCRKRERDFSMYCKH